MYLLTFCRQLSAWMEMVAKFEMDQQVLREILILIHQLHVIHVIFGKFAMHTFYGFLVFFFLIYKTSLLGAHSDVLVLMMS